MTVVQKVGGGPGQESDPKEEMSLNMTYNKNKFILHILKLSTFFVIWCLFIQESANTKKKLFLMF